MIVINGRFLTQRITGVQRFAYEICRALRRIGVNFVILAPSDTISEYAIEDLPVKKIGGKGSHFWEQVTLPGYMHRHYRGLPLLSLSGLSPVGYNHTIMTIHDVSYLLRPLGLLMVIHSLLSHYDSLGSQTGKADSHR